MHRREGNKGKVGGGEGKEKGWKEEGKREGKGMERRGRKERENKERVKWEGR